MLKKSSPYAKRLLGVLISMNRLIHIGICDKIAKPTSGEYIICGNSDFTVIFEFDDEWDDYPTKTARFSYEGKYQDVVFEGNECPIPFIIGTKYIDIGVFAGEWISSTPARVRAKESIVDEGIPDEPPSDVYAQIIELCEKASTDAEEARKAAAGDGVGIKYLDADGGYSGDIFNDYIENTAEGGYAHSEGKTSTASGWCSHAEGAGCIAMGKYSHAQNMTTTAEGNQSHSEGWSTLAKGVASHAEGYKTQALGLRAHTEGGVTVAEGEHAHAEGYKTQALGNESHAEGEQTIAKSAKSHAEGYQTQANGYCSHAEGWGTIADGDYQHVQGKFNEANPDYAIIVGNGKNDGKRSTAHYMDWEGNAWFSGNITVGDEHKTFVFSEEGKGLSHNDYTDSDKDSVSALKRISSAVEVVSEYKAVKVGDLTNNVASGNYAHAEGCKAKATKKYAHAEGYDTTSSGEQSHAEGKSTQATGNSSHAEGQTTLAQGVRSHAEGASAKALGDTSHAEGQGTVANVKNQHVQGQYNKYEDADGNPLKYIHVVGIGTAEDKRKNGHTIDFEGNAWYKGGIEADHLNITGCVEADHLILKDTDGCRWHITLTSQGTWLKKKLT